MRRSAALAAMLVLAGAYSCGGQSVSDAGGAGPSGQTVRPPLRLLMITATAGFRHDSIATAQQVVTGLGRSTGAFSVTTTEDLSVLSPSVLAGYDAILFALTSGELPLSADQKAALLTFVTGGHGFLGVHSASDTLYDWSDYGRLVGAYFQDHPWTQQGSVVVEDSSHPATAGLSDRFTILEEFYTFRDNPRPRVHVLLRLDAVSVSASGDYPLAWTQSFGSGRAYYNALGHFAETWNDPRFQRQLAGAIQWVAGR